MTFQQLISDSLDTCKQVFGEEVTLHPAGGPDVEGVLALFKEAHQEIDPTTGLLVVSSSQPELRLKIADLPGGVHLPFGSAITVRGLRYRVVDQQPVGFGDLLITLHEVRQA